MSSLRGKWLNTVIRPTSAAAAISSTVTLIEAPLDEEERGGVRRWPASWPVACEIDGRTGSTWKPLTPFLYRV